ncbi:MAG: hypothetical protein ABIR26_11415 [Ramlibacter sp.]
MKLELVPSRSGSSATHLWLMLPGAYMKPGDFLSAGFAEAVHARGLPHDIALLDATISEVVDGSALALLQDHLRETTDTPARKVCLLGISLGAQLALTVLARGSADRPQSEAAARVSHAFVMAPYLGPRDLLAEVAGGQRLAQAESKKKNPIDNDREIWRWLQDGAAPKPPLYLGYGSDDRFSQAHALMGRTLPAERVDTQPGGHEWPVWSALWSRHLDAIAWPRVKC